MALLFVPAGIVRRAAVRVAALSSSVCCVVPLVRVARLREAAVLAVVEVEEVVDVARVVVAAALAREAAGATLVSGGFAFAPFSSAPAPAKTPLRPALVISPNAGRLRRAAIPVEELGPLSLEETADAALPSSLCDVAARERVASLRAGCRCYSNVRRVSSKSRCSLATYYL